MLFQWKENSRVQFTDNGHEIDALKEQLLNKDKWCKARVEQVSQTSGAKRALNRSDGLMSQGAL